MEEILCIVPGMTTHSDRSLNQHCMSHGYVQFLWLFGNKVILTIYDGLKPEFWHVDSSITSTARWKPIRSPGRCVSSKGWNVRGELQNDNSMLKELLCNRWATHALSRALTTIIARVRYPHSSAHSNSVFSLSGLGSSRPEGECWNRGLQMSKCVSWTRCVSFALGGGSVWMISQLYSANQIFKFTAIKNILDNVWQVLVYGRCWICWLSKRFLATYSSTRWPQQGRSYMIHKMCLLCGGWSKTVHSYHKALSDPIDLCWRFR